MTHPPHSGKRGLDDSAELPAIPTPETDPRLRIPETLKAPPAGAPQAKPQPKSDLSAMSQAWAMGFDLVAVTLAGAALGWGADYLLKSTPIGIVVGFALGFVTATIRVVRTMNRQ